MTPDRLRRTLLADGLDADATALDEASDRTLVEAVMEVLTDPPEASADSFVLHAPLELMARAELLPMVPSAARRDARRRIAEIAVGWSAYGPHVGAPTRPADEGHTPSPDRLLEAIAAGDVDGADRALIRLVAEVTADEFVAAAAAPMLPYLGAAAHQAIYFDLLTRLQRPPAAAGWMGRAVVRDLARHPDWVLRWIDRPAPTDDPSRQRLDEVLADPPSPGTPTSNFIHPTMHLVDGSGLAAELLAGPVAGIPLPEARRQLLRTAAMSMLHDDPAAAPYGWSHCLTMPQAALALAPRFVDPRRAIAVAATYVLGFRATLSHTAVDTGWQPRRPVAADDERAARDVLDLDTDDAIAVAWHARHPEQVDETLVTYAATHRDAHLAKYTLACLHAGHDDPAAAPLFRAAATRLARWWRERDEVPSE